MCWPAQEAAETNKINKVPPAIDRSIRVVTIILEYFEYVLAHF